VTVRTDIPIPCRIIALMQERNRLFAFPVDRLAIGIWSSRFRCNGCGACCTKTVNPHIFLLDKDIKTVKAIDPAAYEPAPAPEFCDQNGTLYVSGYSLKMRDDPQGSCWFLEDNQCSIYDQRFSGCRIYPHMLRRSPGSGGEITWQQFAHKNDHGDYNPQLSLEECIAIAREIKEYENAFLNQQIAFLETVHEHLAVNKLHLDQNMLQKQLQRRADGLEIDIMVFHEGELERCRYRTTR
jgi:Fe-S-cluster containining protein